MAAVSTNGGEVAGRSPQDAPDEAHAPAPTHCWVCCERLHDWQVPTERNSRNAHLPDTPNHESGRHHGCVPSKAAECRAAKAAKGWSHIPPLPQEWEDQIDEMAHC